MNATLRRSITMTGLRFLLAPVLALTLLPWVLGPATPARAADPPNPAFWEKRIQIVVKSVKIFNDRDWGAGDFFFVLFFWRVNPGCPPDSSSSDCTTTLLKGSNMTFSGDDGETIPLNVDVPGYGYGASTADSRINPAIGIPLYAGESYGMVIDGEEHDSATRNEDMGNAYWVLNAANSWGIGTHTIRSSKDGGQTPNGDYEVELEVRDAELPDLRAVDIKVLNAPGSAEKLVCAAIQNIGVQGSGPFEVAFLVNGVEPPDGRTSAGQLPSGQAGELCVQIPLPAGQHRLAAIVDETRAMVEISETNNRYEKVHVAPLIADTQNTSGQPPVANADPGQTAPPGAATLPASSQTAADLTVGAIRVNGQAPDGKNDCKDGKNDVSVVVKNGGAGKTEKFAVRLTVDGDEAGDRTMDGLEPGFEREVRFEDVRLKKGEQKLTATVDPKNTVAESNEQDNDREVTARCKGAS